MSNIHYFQRYSQRENVTTNNTLLLFSRLYSSDRRLFEEFLNALLSEYTLAITVGVSFKQQEKVERGRVPDGSITQESFKIVIETKQQPFFDFKQLEGHLHAFGDEKNKVLLLLSPEIPDQNLIEQIKQSAKESFPGVKIVPTTFEIIIKTFKEVLDENRHYEMMEMIEEYETFCIETDLLPIWKYIMRARTAGYSFDFNLVHHLYYDHISRGYMKHLYFGLYKQKAVRGVGKIENIVVANLEDGQLVNVHSDLGKEVTPQQREKIIKAIVAAKTWTGDDVSHDCRFFLVERFVETFYEKATPNPILKSKSFDLRKVLKVPELPNDIDEIARQLREVETW